MYMGYMGDQNDGKGTADRALCRPIGAVKEEG
jgi:hypothetical protein